MVCNLGVTPPQSSNSPPRDGGNCTTRGSDTPATRRQKAPCSAKPPPQPPEVRRVAHKTWAQYRLARKNAEFGVCWEHRANCFAHEARQHGDIETNNTTAHPQQGTAETGTTSAPEKCTKYTHFAPAKAMAVSVEARPASAKAMTVSDKRPTWPTEPGGGAHGQQRHHRHPNSHVIYRAHFSRHHKNVAIPTMQIHYLNKPQGNYVRN